MIPPGRRAGGPDILQPPSGSLLVPVEVPLQRRHGGRVQGSRAIAASADPDLKCADSRRTDDTVRPDSNLVLQGAFLVLRPNTPFWAVPTQRWIARVVFGPIFPSTVRWA